MEAMKQMPDKAFDLAIVDPPYGIERLNRPGRLDHNGDTTKWNRLKPDLLYFNELFRISKQQIIWGANNFILPQTEYFIIWDKFQTVDNFASAEYAWTNIKIPAKVFRYSIHLHNQIEKIHPTQKPVALYKWLLKNYAKEGDKILDTHLGSGSIAIACWDFKYDLTGYEIDKDYYDAAVKRLECHKAQELLF
jgi:site-specific DNA-methyltransferase (adenine-specific)